MKLLNKRSNRTIQEITIKCLNTEDMNRTAIQIREDLKYADTAQPANHRDWEEGKIIVFTTDDILTNRDSNKKKVRKMVKRDGLSCVYVYVYEDADKVGRLYFQDNRHKKSAEEE